MKAWLLIGLVALALAGCGNTWEDARRDAGRADQDATADATSAD